MIATDRNNPDKVNANIGTSFGETPTDNFVL